VRGNDESEEGLRWVSLPIPYMRTSRETSEGGTGGVVACSRMRSVEHCDMGVDTSSYSHYSVISIAICLQLRTVLRFLWLDLRSTATL